MSQIKFKQVQFKRWLCHIEKNHYGNDRICISLVGVKHGDPIVTATSNWPQEPLADDEVIMKTWSENEGMLKVLTEAGVVSEPVRYVDNGFVTAPVCKLLI